MINTGNVGVSWSGLIESGLEWTVWEWAGVDCLRVGYNRRVFRTYISCWRRHVISNFNIFGFG